MLRLGNLNKGSTFAPATAKMFIEGLEERLKKGSEKKASKFFKFFLQETKRIFSFAPALRNKTEQKIRHVRRHIELTAVSSKRWDKRNKSSRIERFEKNR